VEGLRFDDKVALVHFLNQLNDGMSKVSLTSAPAASTGRRRRPPSSPRR
jgi:hypothetical protein